MGYPKAKPHAIGIMTVKISDDDTEDIFTLKLHMISYIINDITYAHSIEGNIFGCGESLHEATKDFCVNFSNHIAGILADGAEYSKDLIIAPETIIDMYTELKYEHDKINRKQRVSKISKSILEDIKELCTDNHIKTSDISINNTVATMTIYPGSGIGCAVSIGFDINTKKEAVPLIHVNDELIKERVRTFSKEGLYDTILNELAEFYKYI